jgi:hypothetical protein
MQTLTSLLLTKNPEPSPAVSAIPTARKFRGVIRIFGLGLSNFLNEGKTDVGMEPRDDGGGGV